MTSAWKSSSPSSRARTSTRYDSAIQSPTALLDANQVQLISQGTEKLASVPSGGGGGAAGGAAAGGAAPAEEAKEEEKEEEKEESDEDMGFGLFD